MHQSIKVWILGREYPLRVHENDINSMKEMASIVDARMRGFKNQHPDQTDLVAAVIAALTLAEECVAAREASGKVLETMDHEIKDLVNELTQVMDASGTD